MSNVFYILLSLILISCTSIKPIRNNSGSSTVVKNCESLEDDVSNIPAIVKNIKRYNPEISKTVYLEANYGGATKTLRVYKYRNNNAFERVLFFHIQDLYTYELQIDTMVLALDTKEIKKKIDDDASVVISNTQDLLFYVTLAENEYQEIINSSTFSFKIHDMVLRVDPDCRKLIAF